MIFVLVIGIIVGGIIFYKNKKNSTTDIELKVESKLLNNGDYLDSLYVMNGKLRGEVDHRFLFEEKVIIVNNCQVCLDINGFWNFRDSDNCEDNLKVVRWELDKPFGQSIIWHTSENEKLSETEVLSRPGEETRRTGILLSADSTTEEDCYIDFEYRLDTYACNCK